MDENAKRFARRVLLSHGVLLIVVLALVALAAREIYGSTREQVIAQAQAQSLLASQTARGIQSQYESILNNLDLMRRAEGDEPPGEKLPGDKPATTLAEERPLPDRALAAASSAGVGPLRAGPLATAAAARNAIVGPILWKQLQGRVSLLFGVDRAMLSRSAPTIRIIGTDDPALSPEAVIASERAWLESVQTPAISKFEIFGDQGFNLVCVPYPHGRLVVAVVPIREVESRFLRTISDPEAGAWLIDERLTAMAASRPQLVGANMASVTNASLRNFASEGSWHGRKGTQVIAQPFEIGPVTFAPSMVSVEPVQIAGKDWELLIATSMGDVDGVVSRLFHHALWWGAFVVFSITAILVSTAVQMIRGRLRLERFQHEMLTRELNQAREIQLAWLPDHRPPEKTFDIAAINSPASHISGDFYNWFNLPDGRWVITIGDVTGHGMSAAFLMATTQLLIRNTMARIGDPGACLAEVNRQLCVQVFNGQFVTMLILVIDAEKGLLEVATAGHPPPLIADGESFQPLPIEPQLVLAVDRNAEFVTEKYTLPPRPSILLYTDGVIECLGSDNSRFSPENLQRALYGRYDSAQSLLDRVMTAVNNFRGSRDLTDDLTVVAIQLQTVAAQYETAAAAID